jgi:hypothetical protein
LRIPLDTRRTAQGLLGGRLHSTTYTCGNGGSLFMVDYPEPMTDIAYVTCDRIGRPSMINDDTGTHNS